MTRVNQLKWKKLVNNIELLSLSVPNSVLPILIDFQEVIDFTKYPLETKEELQFMSFEIKTRSSQLDDITKIQFLNDYIYNEKEFSTSILAKNTIDINDWNFSHSLDVKGFNSLYLSLFYCHLAQNLQLPIYLTQSKDDNILKWVKRNESQLICTIQKGTILDEESSISQAYQDDFEIVPPKKVFEHIFNYFLKIFEYKKDYHRLNLVLNLLITISPENLSYLKKRAHCLQNLNQHKLALSDIKKYISYTKESPLPPDIKSLLIENELLTKQTRGTIH